MSNRLKITFNTLFILYVILIIFSISPLYKMLTFFGFIGTVLSTAFIYIIIIFILCFFLYKKNIKSIFFSFISSLFILFTSSIFFNPDYGFYGSIKLIFIRLLNGHYQMFIVSFLSWIIPLISFIGICFYFYDEHKKKENLNQK